ncbi:hypothetical protein Clacol_008321 [Clathrus columnatus]|uniref:AB hydrolase-1 domain-containing protein n=1 Tax=Clathrus columnatus TaxID=1419009 RepID=A0AAV5AMW9_9AGAM|nr:hypothetical protein Clacol_008321 [Clathrus columnatus]
MPILYDIPPEKVFRTPEECFVNLSGFPYEPRYSHLGNLRYAFIDETSAVFYGGKALSAEETRNISNKDIHLETFICLHGQPTWSYLYRKMIPVLLNHVPKGHLQKKYVRRRVLAPDYFGCGRSDKVKEVLHPIDDSFYTFDMHQDYLINFVHRHVINESPTSGEITLVMQDWGLGLGKSPSKGWLAFHDFIKRSPNANVGGIIARGTPQLTPAEIAGYDAPHPNQISKASVRRFPPIVPREPDMPGVPSSFAAVAYLNRLKPSQMRVFVIIGLKDPVLGEPVMEGLIRVAFGTTGTFVYKHPEAGHFVQEWGSSITEKVLDAWSISQGQETETRLEDIEWRAPTTPEKPKL